MKSEIIIEYAGRQVKENDLFKTAVEKWTAAGNEEKSIKKVNLYAQPETNKAYYVINGDFEGDFDM